MTDRDRLQVPQPGQTVGRVKARGQTLAPWRSAKPRQVDDVRRARQLGGARQPSAWFVQLVGVQQDHIDLPEQRLDSALVSGSAPERGRQLGCEHWIDDRVQVAEMLFAHLDLDLLVDQSQASIAGL